MKHVPTDRVSAVPPTPRPRRRKFLVWAYVSLLPVLLLLAVFEYYPAFSGMFYSFFDWRPGFESIFIGFDNYVRMFNDPVWWASFRNLGWIFLAQTTAMWILPLLAAELVVTLASQRLQFVFRTLLIVPLAFPGVVTVLLWSFIYDPNNGVLNRALESLGLGFLAHNWLGDPGSALLSLIFVSFPWIASLPFLIFLTALQNVPSEVFEAAALDGASRWVRFWSIDLPLLASQFRLLFFLVLVQILQFGFSAFLLTRGGPDNATQVPLLRVIGAAFEGTEWGYAAALSTTLFLFTIVASALVVWTQRKGSKEA